jgi:anhydro-N-acetylmuramic acid kinase
MPAEALFIGLISGTSLDGIDATLVDFSAEIPRLLSAAHIPYANNLLEDLRTLTLPGDNEIDRLGEVDRRVALAFAAAVDDLLAKAGVAARDITAIGSHGQTIRHRPKARYPFTLQLGDPNILVERTGITTVADFRRRDMAADGEGAPLVPAFHQALFQASDRPRVVLNLGGIANITCLPASDREAVVGYDTGPANTLLDAWIRQNLGLNFDDRGAWAASGRLQQSLLQQLLDDPYFSQQPPKSTGTEYFNLPWLAARLPNPVPAPEDVQYTLAELTARTVADAIRAEGFERAELLVCGGGVHNRFLLERLRCQLPESAIASTAEYGLDPDWIEAMAFAWLAKRTLAGQSGNLPSVTGAARAVPLGAIYQGHTGLAGDRTAIRQV